MVVLSAGYGLNHFDGGCNLNVHNESRLPPTAGAVASTNNERQYNRFTVSRSGGLQLTTYIQPFWFSCRKFR